MRFIHTLLLATVLVLMPSFAQKPPDPPNNQKVHEKVASWLNSHKDSTGQVRPDLWLKGIEDTKKLKIAAGISVKKNSPKGVAPIASVAPGSGAGTGVIGVQWTQIGPAPLTIDPCSLAAGGCLAFQGTGPDSGQVTDIAIDPRNTTDSTIYIATNDGGIWKSTDAGNTWHQKTDFMPTLSMGAVALDPSNPSIVYAGTGASTFCTGVINCFSKGIGLYKSIDSGDTWTVLNPAGTFNNLTTSRITVLQSGVLLAGTSGGLFRSVDGGLSFGSNSPNFNNNLPVLAGNVTDLHVDAATNTTVYAATNGGGIFRSTDSGATFPTNLFTAGNVTNFPAGFQYLSFAQSTNPNNQTFAANVQNSTGGFAGIYTSANTGGNWTRVNSTLDNYTPAGLASAITCQCGYDQTIGIDPQDAQRIFAAFQEMHLSTNGGGAFTQAVTYNQVHWDHHAITFSPSGHWGGGGAPTRLYIGTDGGIATSPNGTAWTNINNGIATNLLKHIDIGRGSSANNVFTYAGSQDTATEEHRTGFAAGEWHLGIDGDGNGVGVDPNNPLIAYGDDDGTPMFTNDGGVTWNTGGFTTGLPGLAGSYRYAIDPNSSSNVFAVSSSNIGFDGDTRLFRSTTSSPPPGTFSQIDTAPARIRSIANVKTDSNLIWMGLDDGTARVTTNALATTPAFTTKTITGGLANVPVGGVAINPVNTSEVIAVYQGFCGGLCATGNRSKHVFRTTDAGATWTDISGTDGNPSGNLPDLPLRSVVIDPGTLPPSIIVSSDTAVLRSVDLGATWQILGLGLPNVDSTQLAIDYSVTPSLLRVGTFGRSAFELTTATGPLLAVNANLAFGTVCPGQSATAILQIFNVGSSDLHISSITRVSGSADFTLISGPPTPVTVLAGEELDYTIQFTPTAVGNETAVFQISSDDPFRPTFQLPASGTGGSATITTVIPNSGSFGNVCVGSFLDLPLTLADTGACTLSVSNITSSNAQFVPPGVSSFPMSIAAGTSTAVPIRFKPTGFITTALNGTITVASSDPVTPSKTVQVSGTSLPPIIKVSGSTSFGNVCGGTLAQQTLQVANTGPCDLHVTSASINCPDFTIQNNPFPATISHDASLNLTIKFTPTSAGPKSCTLTITSDDPANPTLTFPLTANTPTNQIDVPPTLTFLPEVIQSIGSCKEPEPLTISNKGTCPLQVTNMSIGGTNGGDFGFSGLPSFPISLQPGHTVGDGNLNAVFAPTALARARLGTVTTTYEQDPITHVTTTANTQMCGEGVQTGVRILVTASGVPLATVDSIKLQRVTGNKNNPILNTVDVAKDLPLTTVNPTTPCTPFQYHREFGTVANPSLLVPGSYVVTVQATVNGKKVNQSVSFDVNTCGFNPNVVVKF